MSRNSNLSFPAGRAICYFLSVETRVEIADFEDWRSAAAAAVEELQALVKKLTKEFWPGPLTLVLPKTAAVPDIVTSGLPTVAVRMSRHEVMRGVAKELGNPLAAPSANIFGRLSPTSASAVVEELCGRIPLVVDG